MPDVSDPHYAVMRTTRIVSWSHALWVGRHNSRTMTVGNAEPDGPPPEHVVGSGDLFADLRAAHRAFDPKRTKDACLGLEFVFTASRAAFAGLPDDDRKAKSDQLVETARRYLETRFGTEGQLVSLVLHMDEITPHVHAVALPVHWRVDARAGAREYFRSDDGKLRWRRSERANKPRKVWMLSADRDMGDRTRLSRHQTAWAKACEPLGLSRGREGSTDRHRTARQREADLAKATKRAETQATAFGTARDGLERDRAAVAVEADRQHDDAAELKRLREALDAERADWDASIAGREAALAAERTRLDEAWKAMDERGRKATRWKRDADARDVAQNARADRLAASSDRLDERDEALSELVPVVTRAVAMIDPQTLPPAARTKFFAVARQLGVSIERAGKANPRMAGVAASRRTWEGYQVGG